jgi:dipeptidyl aminopeptidase/acylaminoacyl peptidase
MKPAPSTGYGQKFIDDINADWGGRAFGDVMAVADSVGRLPYADPDRTAAAGFLRRLHGQLAARATTRFKAWFRTPACTTCAARPARPKLWFRCQNSRRAWDDAEMYARWSPSVFVKEFKTPTLVTHGELDYRVPMGQGLQLFTALQLQKVPSKLVLFPDEGHWISKPQNSVLWYKTAIDWINSWVKKQ